MSDPKLAWHGLIVAIQPRIRLTRSLDERTHSCLGYALRIRGTLGVAARDFTDAIGNRREVEAMALATPA